VTAAAPATNPIRRLGLAVGRLGTGISAVGTKELRGRMRGRRAFAIMTLYLILLSIFAWGVYEYQRDAGTSQLDNFGFPGQAIALSATIGQALFSNLLLLETVLIAVLAPAFTSGAISLEREKQTLDMLVTTPLSSLGLVIGKLGSALAYIFLLILASLPIAAVTFLFGGVGPDDLLRSYVLLVCVAIGFGAIGLFISALVKRTQVAIVLTYLTILALTAGTWLLWFFLYATSGASAPGGFIPGTGSGARPAQQMLWLNPFVADLDLICVTSVSGYSDACLAMSAVTGKPYFGSGFTTRGCPDGAFCEKPMPVPVPAVDDAGVLDNLGGFGIAVDPIAGGACPPNARCAFDVVGIAPEPTVSGFPRDTFWPQAAVSFLILAVVLTLLSARLVTPARRGRRRLWRRRRAEAAA
jgi:ABC-type transport system involved in multi-copper enzyme maturation permease subunit